IAYRLRLNSAELRKLKVIGALSFETRGGEPLLSFAYPSLQRTELPRGTRETDVLVFYGSRLKTESFRATLNGSNVLGSFHPNANWREVHRLALHPGENVLVVSGDGATAGKRVKELARLIFAVEK